MNHNDNLKMNDHELLVKIATYTDDMRGVIKDHEQRLRTLEKFQQQTKGAIGILGTLWALVTAVIAQHIRK